MAAQEHDPGADEDRRAFLKAAGRAAVVAPPAMTLMLTTTMNSPAIAASGGGGALPPLDPVGPDLLTPAEPGPDPTPSGTPAPLRPAGGASKPSSAEVATLEDGGSGSPAAIKWPGMLFAGLLALLGLAG